MPAPIYIYPPTTLANRDLVACFKTQKWRKRETNKITLDFRRVEFIAPWAVCLYGAYAYWMHEEYNCQLQIKLNPTTRAGAYIARSGLPDLLQSPASASDLGADSTDLKTIQLSKIKDSSSISPLVNEILKLLDIDNREMRGATKYAIIELVRNAVQHSQSSTGGMVMAQFYPKSGEVTVVVADMGLGIRETLRGGKDVENDAQAIEQAIRPHISGTFKPTMYGNMKDNAGLGLFTTKEIAALSDGAFTLGSGNALREVRGNEMGARKEKMHIAESGGWPGTFAMLQLRRDGIGDFDDLLQTCTETAEKIRKDSLEFTLKFVDDVPRSEQSVHLPVRDFEENVEQAAHVREKIIAPALDRGEEVVLDFSEVQFATQSFAHALFYRLFRDFEQATPHLLLAKCSRATRQSIEFVAGYARSGAAGK